jgi:uncharacterized protein (DUF305 family)
MKPALLGTAVLAVSLSLTACGSSTKSAVSTAAPAAAGAAKAGTFKDGDVTFAQGMIPHHEQAIEMTDMALDPKTGASAALKTIATKIKAGQDPEVKQMTALLKAWGKPMAMDMTGTEMAAMDGMMSSKDMTSLGALKGADFDKTWATMMIAHHKGANPEVQKLAANIISTQQTEITELQALVG